MMSPRILFRRRLETIFKMTCKTLTWLSVIILLGLLLQICIKGITWVNVNFLTSFPSRFPEKAGIYSALWGTVWVISLTALFAIPMGISAAIYLEEYGEKGALKRFIQINIANLAGVPSVIYGLLGLALFVRAGGMGRNLLSGSLTLSLLVLPVIIIATQEALRSVPDSIRHGAYALGATKLQTIIHHVLPAGLPGIMTGIILSLSRAIGETAPLIIVGAASYVAFLPSKITDTFTTIPIQIFNWSSRPQEAFQSLAGAAIIVLLLFLFIMNLAAIIIRDRAQRKNTW
ncbi:MAG: phosphate ABC transporter permease PstA [Bacteriovoracaceae bacterium]|nr:phosphate ABC transporter permease PstA [Bacteriovoracaceae bacterium]